MKINKTTALALFAALGMANADKWNDKRLAAKLAKVDEMVDGKTKLEDKALDKALTQALEAIIANEAIEVVNDTAPATEEATPAAKADKKVNLKDAIAANKAKEANAGKKAPATPAAPKAPTTPGVRETRTRPYLAGGIIAKYGLGAGVTDTMIKELDDAFGKTNQMESSYRLREAWHGIRGFLEATKANKAAAKAETK